MPAHLSRPLAQLGLPCFSRNAFVPVAGHRGLVEFSNEIWMSLNVKALVGQIIQVRTFLQTGLHLLNQLGIGLSADPYVSATEILAKRKPEYRVFGRGIFRFLAHLVCTRMVVHSA